MADWFGQYINSLKQTLGSDYVYNEGLRPKGSEMSQLTVTSVGVIEVILECFFEATNKTTQGRVIIRVPKQLSGSLRKRLFGWYTGIHAKSDPGYHLIVDAQEEKGDLVKRYRIGEYRLLTGLYAQERDDYTLVINRGRVGRTAAIEIVKQVTYELTNDGWIGDE